MHIQEGTNTTLTTCTKMTEEVDRRHGVNGNGSSKGVKEEVPQLSSAHPASGGRLKFFKDGKFILELVRGAAREGERAGWVSVPRKTFWPPPAPAHATAVLPRAERAASLSVSDDNSSIQSSPWQRDHCWKQTTPRRNISKELTFYYCRPSTLLNATIEAASRAKRRRPHAAPAPAPPPPPAARTNGVRNGDAAAEPSADAVDGAADDDRWTDADREKYYHMKLKKPYQYHKLRVYKKTKSSIKRKLLIATVDRLREKVAALPAPVHAKLASCRQEHAMVSPRKRILRELERVSLEDQGGKRRARPAPPPAPHAAAPGPSAPRPRQAEPPPAKHVSSYSIHSLLSMGSAPSPPRPAPAAAAAVPAPTPERTESRGSAEPDSPSPDGFRARLGGRLASPGAARDSPPPHYRYAPRPPSPYARGFAAYRREEVRDPYHLYGGYGAFLPPGAAGAAGAGAGAGMFRAPPLWMHYAMSPPGLAGAGAAAAAAAAAGGSWPPLAHPLYTDHLPKDEPSSDLPLNLSKH